MVPTCVSPNETSQHRSNENCPQRRPRRVLEVQGFLGCKRWGLGVWWTAMREVAKRWPKITIHVGCLFFLGGRWGGVKFKPLEDILHFWRTVINLSAEWIHSDHELEMAVSCFPVDLWHGWSSSNGGAHLPVSDLARQRTTSYGTPNALVIQSYTGAKKILYTMIFVSFCSIDLKNRFYSVISNVYTINTFVDICSIFMILFFETWHLGENPGGITSFQAGGVSWTKIDGEMSHEPPKKPLRNRTMFDSQMIYSK